MVDRIVPAATEETLTRLQNCLVGEDPCGIACEPFRQWVIEDNNFVAGRPDWNVAGAEFVENIGALRRDETAHAQWQSLFHLLDTLGGYDHISDTMTDAGYRKAAFDMMMKSSTFVNHAWRDWFRRVTQLADQPLH